MGIYKLGKKQNLKKYNNKLFLIHFPRTQFNYSKTTTFVVHGFSSAYNDPDIVPIRVALLTNVNFFF